MILVLLVSSQLDFLVDVALENVGENCWSGCNKKQGKCRWCGTKGYCCRKDWQTGNGCDGTFGGVNHHECYPKPGKQFLMIY